MSGKCVECKHREAGEANNICFTYDGFKFSAFKSGMTCAECEKKSIIERFESFGREVVRLDNGYLKVDWPVFATTALTQENKTSLSGFCYG